MLLSLTDYSSALWGGKNYSDRRLNSLEQRIDRDPYNPSLLLEAGRHSYHLARRKYREQGGVPSRKLLLTGLKYYRRLMSNEEWHLQPKDYFYAGYLYHKLGDHYLGRAKDLALEAYHKDYRSRELIALLATVQFQAASSREDYQVALNYYRSLGSDLRDPVLLYNKALTLKNLDKPKEALELLSRGKRYIKAVDNPGVLRRQYQLARARIHIDQGRFRSALGIIEEVPVSRRDVHLKTLYARCLIELERTNRARSLLKEIVSRPDSPDKAKILLKNITDKRTKARS